MISGNRKIKSKFGNALKPNDINLELAQKETNNEVSLHDFFETTSRKGMFNEIMMKVHSVEKKLECELNQKRERLSHLLVAEECAYDRELNEFNQRQMADEFKQRVENLENMENQRVTEQKQLLEMKQMQQHLMNSDEMRPILQKRLLEDSKHCQLKQIQDKQKQREMERDEDRMWFEINKRVNTELKNREEMERSIKLQRNACTVKQLNEQLASKGNVNVIKRNQVEEERQMIEQKLEEMKQFDKAQKLKEIEKQQSLARDLQIQKKHNRAIQDEIKLEELNYGKTFSEFVRNELAAAELKKTSEKNRLKTETAHYLDYLEHMRLDKQLTEAEQEQIVNNYRKKIDEEAATKRDELKRQKKLLDKETYAMQWKQINYKRTQQISEQVEKLQEHLQVRELYLQNIELERSAALKKHQDSLERGKELQHQIDCNNVFMQKQKEEETKRLDELERIDRAHKDMTKKLLQDNNNIMPLHPNYKSILYNRNRF